MKSAHRIPRALGAALISFLVALSASVGPGFAATPEQAPPVAAGQSRVWFLRQLEPGTSFHPPMIYVNGAPIATSAEGTVFYRDFAPGHYVFSVENCLPQQGSSQTLTLPPNTQFALEIQQDDNGAWDCVPPQVSYLRQIQPQAVPYVFAQVNFVGAR
ncbi:MAG TPA: hypothetical protein VFC56_03770 [Stellaceae bacterium]|nr:hypothetical protein [Stellaceae bacterium]